jgi:AcrR family transcriptional regulator
MYENRKMIYMPGDQTPRARRRARTSEAILDAALAIIAEHGLEALSMRELAQRIEYSPSGLYEYYASKDEILDALIARGLAQLSEQVAHASRGETAAHWLFAIGEAYLAFAREHARLYMLVFGHVFSPAGLVRSLDQLERTSAYGRLRLCIKFGIERGEFVALPGESVAQLVYSFWASLHGLATLRLTRLSAVADIDSINQRALHATIARLSRA